MEPYVVSKDKERRLLYRCNSCGCKETTEHPNPFSCENFAAFWLKVEEEWAEAEKFKTAYGPTACDFCLDWYSCPDCPVRLAQEEEDAAEEALQWEAE
jgi:hypothetical protein